MLISKEVYVTCVARYRKYLQERGYDWVYLQQVLVKVEDLPNGSNVDVEVECDYCGRHFSKKYVNYLNNRKTIKKDCCDNIECMKQKRKEVNLKKYNVENPHQRKEIKEKIHNTNLERYGYITPFQNEEVKDKIKGTNLEKYGYENPSQVDIFKQKKIETCLSNWGVENPLQSEINKKKAEITNINKYGFKNPMQNKEIAKNAIIKSRKALFLNNTAPRSKQQEYICDLLNGVLNYPISSCNLDIAFPNEKIYIEYDGGGHGLEVKLGKTIQHDFDIKEMKREMFLKSKGWKIIRIISKKDRLPSDNVILKMFTYAKKYLNTGHSWIYFDIDNSTIINSQGKFNYDFGKLRYLKRKIKDDITDSKVVNG
jgi:very-short-patch-repair endonuclease